MIDKKYLYLFALCMELCQNWVIQVQRLYSRLSTLDTGSILAAKVGFVHLFVFSFLWGFYISSALLPAFCGGEGRKGKDRYSNVYKYSLE
jgi:hypothetical protein